MRIYISGKMTGKPDYKQDFDRVEKELTGKGFTAVNPAYLPNGLDKDKYMPICLAMVDSCDYIYMMAGWEDSKGARLEKAYAEYQDKTVIYEV